jgi:uncharacterized protein (TIGR02145 family)
MKNILPFTVFVALALPGNAQTVTDIDGNVYNTITIGTQVWMKENLRTTKYNDGTAIPLVTDSISWSNLESPGYCWYNNDSAAYANKYGALYNWFTVDTASNGGKNVCPSCWRVPRYTEWIALADTLGIFDGSPYEQLTKFTAPRGGCREWEIFHGINNIGYWWSSTEIDTIQAEGFFLCMRCGGYGPEYFKVMGMSVLCVLDSNMTVINPINTEELIFYPNPAIEKLYLKNINNANVTVIIFDLQGKQVLIKQIDSNPIDISDLSKGIYVIKLVRSENVLTTKFIKE